MRSKKLYIAAAFIFLVLVAIGVVASIPAPPVNQNLGFYDTQMKNVSVDHTTEPSTGYACRDCHQKADDNHHSMLNDNPATNLPNTTLGCLDCHPLAGQAGQQSMTFSKNCHDCHDGTAFWANPALNLSLIRGSPGRPHHNQTKASSMTGINATYWAADRKCTNCHGSSLITMYNNGHYVPSYNTSMVTPMADFKINETYGGGRKWGGCQACHDQNAASPIYISGNHDTHHYEVLSETTGAQCNYCHVSQGSRAEPIPDYSPDPSASPLRIWFNQSYQSYVSMFGWDTSIRHVEVRNNTILATGDTVNGSGCEKCHDVSTLHNIESNAPGLTVQQTLDANISGYGHIGNNSDCNGCHVGWRGAATNPFPGPTSILLASVTPAVINAGTATTVTLAGSGFQQVNYTTTVLIDGNSVTPDSVTDSEIIVQVPALSAGEHSVQVQKTDINNPDIQVTSAMLSLTAIAPPTITSAELASGTLTITGAGFGTSDLKSVVVNKADGRVLTAATTSWSDTQVVANGADAAVGDTVTVVMASGSATATITGAEPTPTPTPAPTLTTITISPSSANVRIGGTQTFTATALDQYGQPMRDVVIAWSSDNTVIGTVNPTSATTDSNGQATTQFTATKRQGTVKVSANSESLSANATVTVTAR